MNAALRGAGLRAIVDGMEVSTNAFYYMTPYREIFASFSQFQMGSLAGSCCHMSIHLDLWHRRSVHSDVCPWAVGARGAPSCVIHATFSVL